MYLLEDMLTSIEYSTPTGAKRTLVIESDGEFFLSQRTYTIIVNLELFFKWGILVKTM